MIKQHTPGPWHWINDGNGNKWGSRGLEPAIISGTVEGLVSVDDADARLIAAAPDLLAALQFYANADSWRDVDTGIGLYPGDAIDYGATARAAIAKATGEA